jgi:prepilin-type N-terminal cleavage/methylation domain-containing protein
MPKPRPAFSLLELIVVAALMSVVVASVGILLRSTQSAWGAHSDDAGKIASAHATLRHVARHLRQATAVTAISGPTDNSGSISVTLTDTNTHVWDHSGSQVNYGITTASNLLATHIDQLTFVGYEVDGTTTTTTAGDVHAVKCTVQVTLSRDTNATRTASCWVWVRAW